MLLCTSDGRQVEVTDGLYVLVQLVRAYAGYLFTVEFGSLEMRGICDAQAAQRHRFENRVNIVVKLLFIVS